MSGPISIRVWRDGYTGLLQLEIGDDNGGYRIAGPKFLGMGDELLRAPLDRRSTIDVIRRYLDTASNQLDAIDQDATWENRTTRKDGTMIEDLKGGP